MTVTAAIANTFVDGSPIVLYVDDKPAARQLTDARSAAGIRRTIHFPLTLSDRKPHRLAIGGQTITVDVE